MIKTKKRERKLKKQQCLHASSSMLSTASATSQNQHATAWLKEESLDKAYKCSDCNFKTNQLKNINGKFNWSFTNLQLYQFQVDVDNSEEILNLVITDMGLIRYNSLNFGKSVWLVLLHISLVHSPGGQERNKTGKFGINIILILLKVIVKHICF